jgi:hypothetical protein
MQEIKLNLSIAETNLILEALGQMPYVRVFELIANIQQQAQAQLSATQELNVRNNGPRVEDINER